MSNISVWSTATVERITILKVAGSGSIPDKVSIWFHSPRDSVKQDSDIYIETSQESIEELYTQLQKFLEEEIQNGSEEKNEKKDSD